MHHIRKCISVVQATKTLGLVKIVVNKIVNNNSKCVHLNDFHTLAFMTGEEHTIDEKHPNYKGA